ncbi:MAG: GNAT family N-acetyltransferase, partial [Ekhidna sp.]
MEFRLGKKEDSSAIKAIDSSIGSDSNRAEFIDLSLQQGTVRVALDDGEIVGYSVVNYSFFRRPTLEMLMISESRRGEGIGKTLLRQALTTIGENRELWTTTNKSNTWMQSLLESEGFKKTGTIDNLDPGDPELVYFKKPD